MPRKKVRTGGDRREYCDGRLFLVMRALAVPFPRIVSRCGRLLHTLGKKERRVHRKNTERVGSGIVSIIIIIPLEDETELTTTEYIAIAQTYFFVSFTPTT